MLPYAWFTNDSKGLLPALVSFAEAIGYTGDKHTLSFHLLREPDFPGLQAGGHVLRKQGLICEVLEIPINVLPSLGMPVLVWLHGQDTFAVLAATEQEIVITAKGLEKKVTATELETQWDGRALVAEQVSGEKITPSRRALPGRLLLLIVLALLSAGLYQIVTCYTPFQFILLLSSFVGLGLSIPLLLRDAGFDDLVSSVCHKLSPTSKRSCEKPKEQYRHLIPGIAWSTASTGYFLALILSLLLLPLLADSDLITVLTLVSLATLPVILWSWVVQSFLLRSWCLFCVLLSFLLISQVGFMLFMTDWAFPSQAEITTFGVAFFIAITLSFALNIVLNREKELIRSSQKLNTLIRSDSFSSFLKNQPSLTFSGLADSGYSEAKYLFVLSLSCPHCKKAFDELETLLSMPLYKDQTEWVITDITSSDPKDKALAVYLNDFKKHSPKAALSLLGQWYRMKRSIRGEEFLKQIEGIDSTQSINTNAVAEYNALCRWFLHQEANSVPARYKQGSLIPLGFAVSELGD